MSHVVVRLRATIDAEIKPTAAVSMYDIVRHRPVSPDVVRSVNAAIVCCEVVRSAILATSWFLV